MRPLLYEIAANALALPGILGEYAYWQVRIWGLSERDIIHGTLASASIGAAALYCYAHPEARVSGGMASLVFMAPMERIAVWIFRQERTFYMARVIVLFVTIFYVGYTLVTSAPSVFGQARQHQQVQDNTRELATHGAAIDSLNQWRRDMEAANMPGRLMVMERNVAEMREDQKYLARLLYGSLATGLIWLIQQMLALLRKGSKAD